MLTIVKRWWLQHATSIASFFLIYFLSSAVFSAPASPIGKDVTAFTMLQRFAEQLPELMRLLTAIAYTMGFFFMVFGIFKLKQYGESRTMMSTQHSLKGPLVYLMVGAALIYLPTTLYVGLTTFWANPSPYAYLEAKDPFKEVMSVIFTVIQFVGVIAVIRGLVIFTHIGEQGGGQQGAFGKGLTHVIGGVLCINMYQFVQVIESTFGITLHLS